MATALLDGLRIAVLCAVVEELRAGPLALYFSSPQWVEATEAYLRTGEVGFDDEGDSESEIQGPQQAPYVEWPPQGPQADWPQQAPGQWEDAFNQLFGEEEWSDGDDSTTEPSVAEVSSSSSSVSGLRAEGLSPEDRIEGIGGLPAHYEARDGTLVVRYCDDEHIVPLVGWSLGDIETIVQGLTEGDWEAYYGVIGSSSNQGEGELTTSLSSQHTSAPESGAASSGDAVGDGISSCLMLSVVVVLPFAGFGACLLLLVVTWLVGVARRIHDVDQGRFRSSYWGSGSGLRLTGVWRLLFLFLWVFFGGVSPAGAVSLSGVEHGVAAFGLGNPLDGEGLRGSAVEKGFVEIRLRSGDAFCYGDHCPVFWRFDKAERQPCVNVNEECDVPLCLGPKEDGKSEGLP